jgi:hypothetical protein
VGKVLREVESSLVSVKATDAGVDPRDELAKRRNQRAS